MGKPLFRAHSAARREVLTDSAKRKKTKKITRFLRPGDKLARRKIRRLARNHHRSQSRFQNQNLPHPALLKHQD
jgi:hypothetical protein